MTAATIVIPVYNALKLTQACIESIYLAHARMPFEVIVVNNGSSPDVQKWLSLEEKCRPNLHALHFDRPLGFARAMNVGARRAKHEFLVLLNSDTIVTDGWLGGLREALFVEPSIGIVSPVTNSAGNEIQTDPDARTMRPHQASWYAERIRNRRELIFDPHRLAFFCVMMPRALWKGLSGLEERYGTGNFEDDDFCLRARLAGYRLGVVRNVFVFHHQEATFRANHIDHELLMEQNQLLFCDRASKWSRSLDSSNHFEKQSCSKVSVIVPVAPGCAGNLRDSLASLANQTVSGFETVVISPPDPQVSEVLSNLDVPLKIKNVKITGRLNDQPVAALNAGLEAATGDHIAYLSSGDIYYPFHVELLESIVRISGVDAAYTGWSEVDYRSGFEQRSLAELSRLALDEPTLGKWLPLSCWMYSRDYALDSPFDESLRTLYDWEFLLRLSRYAQIQYIPRVTWERRLHRGGSSPRSPRIEDVERVMKAFPVTKYFQSRRRARYMEIVKTGGWENLSLVTPSRRGRDLPRPPSNGACESTLLHAAKGALNSAYWISQQVYRLLVPLSARHQIDRKAREICGLPPAVHTNHQKLQHARDQLRKTIAATTRLPYRSAPADICLFNIIEWDHLTQRPHHLARELLARGHRIFWVDVHFRAHSRFHSKASVQKIEPGIFHVALPAVKGSIYKLDWSQKVLAKIEMAVDKMRAAYRIENAIQLVNFPKWAPLVFRLRTRFGWPVVYDCLDDQKSFSTLYGLDSAEFEDGLAQSCDLLVTCSRLVHKERRDLNVNTALIPNGCDYDLFSSAVPSGVLAHLPRPVVGFFGAFADWLDFDWIEEAARHFPLWSFVYVGRPCFARPTAMKRWRELTKAANIHVFPQAQPTTLASYLCEFDVCTMPFQDLPVTRAMNPVKVYEYLAAGKLVVVPDFDEMQPLADKGLITIYRDKNHSFQVLKQITRAASTARDIAARQSFAARNTWTERAEKLAANFASVGSRKEAVITPIWAKEQSHANCLSRHL